MTSAPTSPPPRVARRPACPLFALALLAACSTTKFAADTTASFLAQAAPAARAYFDYETAGLGAANGLLQLEGLHHVSPQNERLTLLLAQAYVAYAFGWVMDRQEEEQFAGNYERADREKQRAYLMYERAHELTLRLLRERDPGIDRLLFGDPDKLAARLRERFNDRDRDVELVFWSALAWGSTVTNAPGLDALADLPAVKTLALHSVALDESYEDAGALALLGGFESSYPQQLGGNWAKGKAYFERALRLSRRRNHMHHINFARTYAVNAQDKALFVSLLREVIEAGDQGDQNRLSNKVARRRAERYLSHIDDYFE